MTLAFAELPDVDSRLRGLDPRWKLAALTAAVAAVASFRTLPAASAAGVAAVVLAGLGRLPGRWCAVRLGSILLFLAPFIALLPFLYPASSPVFAWGFVRLSLDGLRLAGLIVVKALTMALLLLVLVTSAAPPATLKAAQSLHVPGVLVQLLALTYRYVFVLVDELSRIRIALRVRGYRNRPDLRSYRTIGHVTGTLLVRSVERAERVGQAMRCRGFTGTFRALTAFRTRPADVLFAAGVVACSVALVLWDRGR